jgi:hypothetical protein
MDKELMAKGMALGMKSMGIFIEDWQDTPESTTVWISVPKESTDAVPGLEPLAGKKLADRFRTKMQELIGNNFIFYTKFRIRDEVWTKEKRLAEEARGKREMYGRV